MAFLSRFNNDPYLSGYIIRQFINCGKKNCHCYKDGMKHEVYRLRFREYFLNGTKSKQKVIHIKKANVSAVQYKLAVRKGIDLLLSLGDWAIFEVAHKYPSLVGEAIQIKAYQDYGHSIHAQRWLYCI